MSPRVAVVSFSPVSHDQRVMRQIRAVLRAGMEAVVVGFDCDLEMPADLCAAKFFLLNPPVESRIRLIVTGALLAGSRVVPSLGDAAIWRRPWLHEAAEILRRDPACDVIIANDVEGLAVACRVRKCHPGIRILFDAHEYFLQLSTGFRTRMWTATRSRILRRDVPKTQAMTTVCGPLSELYAKELGVPCGVVYNATAQPVDSGAAPPRWNGGRRLRLVHHGFACQDRGLEKMAEAMAHAPNAELHFYLAGGEPEYLETLRGTGVRAAPGRVFIHPPVKPLEVAATLVPFDLGLSIITPGSSSLLNALPNKFFDCLNSGLGVVAGPSPAMRQLIEKYGCGVSGDSFAPESVGRMIAAFTPEKVAAMREGARRAAQEINHDTECGKVADLVRRCLAVTASRRID
jgi:hypothetical protein